MIGFQVFFGWKIMSWKGKFSEKSGGCMSDINGEYLWNLGGQINNFILISNHCKSIIINKNEDLLFFSRHPTSIPLSILFNNFSCNRFNR